MASNFPKPTPFMIGESVVRGLAIPAIQIDPRFNFVRGAFIFASDIQLLDLKLRSFRQPLEQARDMVIIPAIRENFAQQGRPPWKALSKKTVYNRLIEGYPRGPILDKTGRLKRAATKKNIWNITSAVGRSGYDMLQLRTIYFDQLVPYAQYHQLGARLPSARKIGGLRGMFGAGGQALMQKNIKFASGVTEGGFVEHSRVELFPTSGGKLPARPFISITLEDEVEIYNIFTAWLTVQVHKFWGMKGDKGL